MLLAYDEKDVAAKTHYENKYFSIDVPEDWIGYWDVIEEENSLYVDQILYRLSYKPPVENYGGGAEIYILDMSDTSVPLSVYRASIPDYAEEVGVVSFADYDVCNGSRWRIMKITDSKSLGQAIRERRKELNYTQSNKANRCSNYGKRWDKELHIVKNPVIIF